MLQRPYRHSVRTWLEWSPAVKKITAPATRRGFGAEDLELGFDASGSCWRRSTVEMMLKEEDSNNCVKKKKC